MRKTLTFLFSVVCGTAFAQVSTDSLAWNKPGMTIWFESSLTENASLQRLRDQLAPLGITLRGNRLTAVGFSTYHRLRRTDNEGRFWGFGNEGVDIGNAARAARVEGLGIGLLTTYRLVDTRRWMVGPGAGYDFLGYRLRIDAPVRGTVPIQNLLVNAAPYRSVNLYGRALTVNFALTAGYRFNLFRRMYDGWQLNARVGYHLPLISTKNWTYDQNSVGDLDAYQPNNLYFQIGLVSFPNDQYVPWRMRRKKQ